MSNERRVAVELSARELDVLCLYLERTIEAMEEMQALPQTKPDEREANQWVVENELAPLYARLETAWEQVADEVEEAADDG